MELDPIMGGDDFSAYQAEAPGCYAFIGAGGEYPHHHPRFRIDERALADRDAAARRRRAASPRGVRVKPFTVAVDDDVLDDLRRRLDATRWPDEAPDAARARFRAGAGARARRVLARRLRLARGRGGLNGFEQFVTDGVHYIAEGDGPPLLLLHGWPSSVWEFHRIIPLLRPSMRVDRPVAAGLRLLVHARRPALRDRRVRRRAARR